MSVPEKVVNRDRFIARVRPGNTPEQIAAFISRLCRLLSIFIDSIKVGRVNLVEANKRSELWGRSRQHAKASPFIDSTDCSGRNLWYKECV
jgi:hypothetical protein